MPTDVTPALQVNKLYKIYGWPAILVKHNPVTGLCMYRYVMSPRMNLWTSESEFIRMMNA